MSQQVVTISPITPAHVDLVRAFAQRSIEQLHAVATCEETPNVKEYSIKNDYWLIEGMEVEVDEKTTLRVQLVRKP